MKRADFVAPGLALLSAALCALAVPPLRLWPLAVVCLVPLTVAVTRAPLARAATLGLLHGVVLNAWAFSWTVPAMVRLRGVSPVLAIGMLLVLSLVHGGRFALIALVHAWATSRRVPAAIALPLATVTAELVCPMLFPWHVGFLAGAELSWIQLAELGGPLLTSLWVALANGSFAQAWLDRRGGRLLVARSAGLGVVVIAVVTGLGQLLLTRAERSLARFAPARIGIVQFSSTATKQAPDPFTLFRSESAKLSAFDPRLDLLIWPETSVTTPVAAARLGEVAQALHQGRPPWVAPIPVPLLAGFVVQEDHPLEGSGPVGRTLFNSAVLSAANGDDLGRYDKRTLVTFGERSPLASIASLGPAQPFEPGTRSPLLVLGSHTMSVSVCYEDILAMPFRASVSDHTDLLVNLTSDQWFTGSAGPYFHLALATYRAVEHRRYLVRATTTGITAVIAPTGQVVWTLPEAKAAAGVTTAGWSTAHTPYETYGDWPFVVVPLGLALTALLMRRGVPAGLAEVERSA